ncbi:MAG: shikimate kinase [Candidatus Bathyarchaeota archaeon]
MAGYGEAMAHGAATVVNAIAIGRGAAFGVDLKTVAKVELTLDIGAVKGRIIAEPEESTNLIEKTVLRVLRYFNADKKFGAVAETESEIPVARGLKSSSAAANALVLATAAALGKKIEDSVILALSVDSAMDAKTTITGAYDDVCASYFGNMVITHNVKRKILKKYAPKRKYNVVFQLPSKKVYTATSNVERMRLIAPQVELAFQEALSGNYWAALTLNGMLYSAALGYDPTLAVDALEAGAIASGLSGKGPATVAVVSDEKVNDVIRLWRRYEGRVIKTKMNSVKAHVLKRE